MDPVESWIDAEAVRRMARDLLSPRDPGGVEPPEDTGFGPDFEGFADVANRRVATATAGPENESAGVVPAAVDPAASVAAEHAIAPREGGGEVEVPESGSAPAADEARPFLVAAPAEPQQPSERRQPLIARLEQYRDWLREKVGVRGVFILDRDGNPVLEDPAYGKLHFLARSLSQAYRPVEGEPGNVHVKIGAESFLSVIPVDTDFGRLVLGAVLAKPLNAEAVAIVTRVLGEAARPAKRG